MGGVMLGFVVSASYRRCNDLKYPFTMTLNKIKFT